MKKTTALVALTAAGLALAAPAHADGTHGRINIAGRPLSPNKLCETALGIVPLTAPWTGSSVYDACNNRPHVHPERAQQPGPDPASDSNSLPAWR
ncbi:hypothetical protein ABB07_27130 [Streptomyces incarnatus]|uniref:Chaplin domain-containing protein n=1 Tax=Streptomyces incarnatus TaxID=665007 RepID=A0ABM5TRA8_9ACTN|nr:hypothetical protein [Streptomyces incarnatus]AKJ13573.1 hypothetical protein ABB07_27130 [Streptomyces incarnatus]